MHEGNGSHPAALENRQTFFHWEAQVVWQPGPPEEFVQDVGCHPVCTPCPEGMSIKKEKDLETGTIDTTRECAGSNQTTRPCGELGPITRAGTTYRYHTVLLPRSSLNVP